MNHSATPSAGPVVSRPTDSPPLFCTVAVVVHDESANVERCLASILDQQAESVVIERIVVVSSGSTDGTDRIVSRLAETHPIIELVTEPERRGKIAALNLVLRQLLPGELIVSIGGDLVAEPGWLEALVAPFTDPKVGMTGARPIPVDDETSFCGYLAHVLWRVHDRVARVRPKLGEAIAFRHPGEELPEWVIVDEAFLEHRLLELGRRLEYVPEAIVRNKGPETPADFVRQYRRNVAGHLVLRRRFGHTVATLSIRRTLRALRPELAWSVRRCWRLAAILALSLTGRLIGHWDHRVNPDRHRIWKIARTTKRLPDETPELLARKADPTRVAP